VDQQVAHLDVAGDPGIGHAKLRQVPGHRVVPLELALVDQPRQQAGGHGLGVGSDLEQRVGIDPLATAGACLAGGAQIHDTAILHHRHGQAWQHVAGHGLVEQAINCVLANGLRRRCGEDRHGHGRR
jgi:hypothetical protein